MFEKCQAVPRRLWFDNLSAAVFSHVPSDEHSQRTLTEGFIRFRAHYGFDAVFCAPRKGNEKGNVENKCGYTRRNWCVPIPCFKDFESLTKELNERAEHDALRDHYYKEGTIASLFEEEKEKFLKLPDLPYEVFKISSMALNKYSELTIDKKNYKVFNGLPNQTVLLKTYWNEVKVLTENHELIETLPRPYTFKPQEVKWLDVFRNYVTRPRTYQYSQFKKMLPECINTYLTEDATLQKERLKSIYHWLGNYELKQICEIISLRKGQETPLIISQRLAALHGTP